MNPSMLAVIAGIFLGAAVIALVVVIISKRLRRRWAIGMFALVIGSLAFLTISTSTLSVSRESYDRCAGRVANIKLANNFYRQMAALEAKNKFIDAKFRAHRVALYLGVVYAPPDCGARP